MNSTVVSGRSARPTASRVDVVHQGHFAALAPGEALQVALGLVVHAARDHGVAAGREQHVAGQRARLHAAVGEQRAGGVLQAAHLGEQQAAALGAVAPVGLRQAGPRLAGQEHRRRLALLPAHHRLAAEQVELQRLAVGVQIGMPEAAHGGVDGVVQRARGRVHGGARRRLGGQRGGRFGVEVGGVEPGPCAAGIGAAAGADHAEQRQLVLQHRRQHPGAGGGAQLVRGPEAQLVDLLRVVAERAAALDAIGGDVLGLHRGTPHVLVHRRQGARVDGQTEFLGGFADGGGPVALSGRQVAADRGVPPAGLNLLAGRALLQQQAAAVVVHQHVDGAVAQRRRAMYAGARDDADHRVVGVDQVQKFLLGGRRHRACG